MSKEIVATYILVFHDKRDLYKDILFRLDNTLNKDIDELKDMFSIKAQELLTEWGFDDGRWELVNIADLKDIEVLTLD